MENLHSVRLPQNHSCCSVRVHNNGESVIENCRSSEPSQGCSGREHETDRWTDKGDGKEWVSVSMRHDLLGTKFPNNLDVLTNVSTHFFRPEGIIAANSGSTPGEPKRERRNLARTAEEIRAVAYHEAGHAVVAWRLPFGPTVTEVTVIPLGISHGHVRWQERLGLPGHEDLLDLTCAELGGMAAESLFLGEVTPLTNISDLQDANHAATKAIADNYVQMHDKIRPELLPSARRTLTQTVICEAYCKTRELLKSHETDVHKVASALISQRSLKWRNLHKLLGPPGRQRRHLQSLPDKLTEGVDENQEGAADEIVGESRHGLLLKSAKEMQG